MTAIGLLCLINGHTTAATVFGILGVVIYVLQIAVGLVQSTGT